MSSSRLRRLIELMPECQTVADIGTDHAWLLREALRRGKAEWGIGTDKRPDPLDRARDLVAREGLTERIKLRLGFGLQPLGPGEADTIVVAGLGGHTVRQILASHLEVAKRAGCLLLQPNNAMASLRAWLLTNGFLLCHEDLVQEGWHIYCVIMAASDETGARTLAAKHNSPPKRNGGPEVIEPASDERGLQEAALTGLAGLGLNGVSGALWLEWGPLLLARRHPLLKASLEKERDRLAFITDQAMAGGRRRAVNRSAVLTERLVQVEKVIAWLSESIR